MKKTTVSLIFLIFTFVIYGELFAADALTKAEAPKIQVGDTWLYTKTVGTNVLNYNYKVTNVNADGNFQVLVERAEKTWNERYDSNLNVIEDGFNIYEPSRTLFKFPLEVGKKFDDNKYVRKSKKDPTDSNLSYATINSIVSEKVTVKAGTFNTLKIDLEASYQGSHFGKPFKNKIVETYWYAPEVGRWVKRNFTDLGSPGLESWELISYQRAK